MATIGRRRARTIALAAGLAGVLAAVTACGGGAGEEGESGEITLVVETFGNFGYDALIQQYMEENPGITVEERNTQRLEDYGPQLLQNLAAGSGAGDVVAIEEGQIEQIMAANEQFVNLLDHGAGELQGNFLSWKWERALTQEGDYLVGLGTDMGGLAMCYRADLFEAAGLPTDREEVGEQWATWDDFIAMGEEFVENSDAAFVDNTTIPYSTIVNQLGGQQGGYTHFDPSGELVVETNPVIRQAFDQAVAIGEAGISANLEEFTEDWTAGLQQSAFAVTTCPAWMLGQIQDGAGEDLAGSWDVAATVPGGGGNWGGSWLGVPAQSEHPEEAAALAQFLTSPEGHISAFQEANTLPTSPEALQSPEVLEYTNEYFSDAPVGEIYGTTALELEPVYLGTLEVPVRTAIQNQLRAVENGDLTPDEAWEQAVAEAEAEAR
ncbi:ABC transporter substrate-binding protein [Allonocardiopsis opalescens]|nr:ABC transporter substrate-binding protein [Allonocardiopsis opalescens]